MAWRRPANFCFVAAAAFALTLAPAARAQLQILQDGEARQRVLQNGQRIQAIEDLLPDINARQNELNQQTRLMRQQMTELSQQRQAAQQQNRELLGVVEELRATQALQKEEYEAAAGALQRRARELAAELAQVKQQLEELRAAVPKPDEGKIYADAFLLLQQQKFREAIDGYGELINHFPDGQFHINSRYWIANAHLSLGQHDQAKQRAEALLTNYPGNDKEPDALLIVAQAARGLGDAAGFVEGAQRLIAKHPTSLAADQARQLLASQ